MEKPDISRGLPGEREYGMHVTSSKGAWSYRLHTHEGYGDITYVKEGVVRQTVNGVDQLYPTGSLLWTREKDLHDVRGNGFTYLNLVVRSIRMAELAHMLEEDGAMTALMEMPQSPFVVIPVERRKRVEEDFQELQRLQQESRGRLVLDRVLVGLLVDWFLPLATNEPSSSKEPAWLSEAVRYAGREIENGFALADLRKRCGRSPEHISRSFQEYLGVTPSTFLNQVRLDRAALLLASTNRPILDICYALGFASPGHFYRLFRQRFGKPPRVYRMTMNPMWR